VSLNIGIQTNLIIFYIKIINILFCVNILIFKHLGEKNSIKYVIKLVNYFNIILYRESVNVMYNYNNFYCIILFKITIHFYIIVIM